MHTQTKEWFYLFIYFYADHIRGETFCGRITSRFSKYISTQPKDHKTTGGSSTFQVCAAAAALLQLAIRLS